MASVFTGRCSGLHRAELRRSLDRTTDGTSASSAAERADRSALDDVRARRDRRPVGRRRRVGHIRRTTLVRRRLSDRRAARSFGRCTHRRR